MSHFKIRIFLAVFLFPLVGIFISGCSHTTPYYKADLKDQSVKLDSLPQLQHRLLIIGDAGAPKRSKDPVLTLLEKWASLDPDRSTVLFLGDNIYPAGLFHPDSSGHREGKRRLNAQLNVVKKSGAKGIFIPGNHDWNHSKDGGLEILKRQASYVTDALNDPNSFLPKAGCPGPAVLDIEGYRLVVLDSEWWLYEFEKESDCANTDTAAVLAALEEAISTAGNREVVVLAHHPILSRGPHGGFFEWTDHLFPLRRINKKLWIPFPIIGSLYPIGRTRIFPNNQDIFGPKNKKMRADFNRVFRRNPPLFYASGHDHSLQVFDGEETIGYYLLSGSGSLSKTSPAGHNSQTLFSYSQAGFMVADLFEDGRVLLRVVVPETQDVVFEHFLK